MHPLEVTLSVSVEDIQFELRGHKAIEWADFLLNPRRLRGSDFLMRWSQGQWSEERLIQAINTTDHYFALPYGPSGTAPEGVREFELYFERLENAGLGKLKRPDLLTLSKKAIYKFYYHYAYPLGETQGEVTLLPDKIVDANGHILPYVRFHGGIIHLVTDALTQLDREAQREHTLPSTTPLDDIQVFENAESEHQAADNLFDL